MSWQQLANDPHNIKFLIGADADDENTKSINGDNVEILVYDKDVITCGGRVKVLAEKLDVDIYVALVDYYFCLTLNWDIALRNLMINHEVINMACVHEMAGFNFTATSRKWRDLANPVEPTIFPFWFSDQWRLEMCCYVFNQSPPLFTQISAGGRHQRTQNLHDLDYWWGLFHALRPMRVRQAYEIAKSYCYAAPTFEEFAESRIKQIGHYSWLDFEKRKELGKLEEIFGQLGAKSEKYLKAKALADKLIEDEGLEIWKMKPIE